jgi:uncharacterized protein (UPF0332 family)
MTITEKDRDILIKYRIEQAHEAIEAAKILIDSNKLKSAVNRIYYGMFYILSAMALKHRFNTSKHQGIIAWFNKEFIKNKKIDRKYGAILNDAFDNRSESDYGVLIELDKGDVLKSFEDMKEFISTIEEFINTVVVMEE